MPIYDYECQDCGRVSEVLVRGAESRTARCAGCGSDNVRRLITSSYMIRNGTPKAGTTCCGSTERCETSPCSTGGTCRRA